MSGWSKTGAARRLLVFGAALAVAGSALATPAIAARPSPGSGGGWRQQPETRAPITRARVTGRQAARQSVASPRRIPEPVRHARPSRFRAVDPGPAVVSRSAGTARTPRVASPGELVSAREMPGIDQGLVDLEPPDPWIGVNASYLVQSTNGLVRVSDRSGRPLLEVATWALFSIPGGYVDSDPRIIWDATHGRWLGVVVAFDALFTDTFLSLIVSDGGDPRAGWSVYQYGYGPFLPDYPAIASSSDKIVLTANEYEDGDAYAGSSFLVLPWSAVLAGTDVNGTYDIGTSAWNLRPGRLVSAATDLHFVYEGGDGFLWYLQLSGSPTALVYVDASLGIPDGAYDLPAPRQPGDPDGIALADDGRIPDAVWRSGQLWFVRTVAGSWDGGSTTDLVVEVTRVETVSRGDPTLALDAQSYHGELGSDAFLAGVGLSGDGAVFLDYSRSSASNPPSIVAEAFRAPYAWTTPLVIEDSGSSYEGDRWGDFVGMAADPSGSATVWQSNEVAAGDGSWRTVVSRLVLDFVPPSVPTKAPNQALVSGSTLGSRGGYASTIPVRVSWGTASDPGSGVSQYALQVAELGDPTFYGAVSTSATSAVRPEYWKPAGSSVGLSYRYRVQALDDAGNAGGLATGSALTPTVYQQTSASYSSGWHTSTNSAFSAGSVKYSTKVGASAAFKTSGRSFAVVSYRSSTRGKVKVYVDGKYKKRVTLRSSTTRARNLVYVISYASSGTHTIKLVVYSGRVDVDAFVVLK